MRIKKWLLSVLSLVCMLSLCGCSLAVPEAGTDGNRLIGAFITDDYLDLFQTDIETDIRGDFRKEGRLYATIDKSGGERPEDWKIMFEGVEGFHMLQPVWTDENGEKYAASECSEEICDLDLKVNFSDGSEENSISGTIYFLPGKADENIAYHANPVYQTEDGRIYAVPGQGFSTSGESDEGEHFSTTLSEETTAADNEKKKAEKGSVTVRYCVMHKPVKITVYQMDKSHQILEKKDYNPGEMPEELTAKHGAEYFLVETEKEMLSGEKMISREVYTYNPQEYTSAETFYALDNGIVAKQTTEIKWSE